MKRKMQRTIRVAVALACVILVVLLGGCTQAQHLGCFGEEPEGGVQPAAVTPSSTSAASGSNASSISSEEASPHTSSGTSEG